MNRDSSTGLPDFIAALIAGLNSETQDTNLNFSNPLWQMPMEMSFDENNFSAPIILGGERPEWVHDMDIIVFGRDNDEAMVAENAEDEDWVNELAFRVMDRNQNLRLKEMVEGEEAEIAEMKASKVDPTPADADDKYFIVVADAPQSQVGVLAVKAHCPSCVHQMLAVKGYNAQVIMTLEESGMLIAALNEAVAAVSGKK